MTGLRKIPNSIETEQVVLGSFLSNYEIFIEVSAKIKHDFFYNLTHRLIFQAISELLDNSITPDPISVFNHIKANSPDVEIELQYLLDLSEIALMGNMEHYLEILKERYILRELIAFGHSISEVGYNPNGQTLNAIFDGISTKYNNINSLLINKQKPYIVLKEAVFDYITQIQAQSQSQKVVGVMTGLQEIDNITGGLMPGELIIVAGRPGMGKTAFALSIAENVSIVQKRSSLIFSLEMTTNQITGRIISLSERINSRDLRSADLTHDDMEKLYVFSSRIKDAPLFITYSAGVNVNDIKNYSRKVKSENEALDLIIIDYVQIISSHRNVQNRAQELAEISRQLKVLALELDVPIMVLSQLNRDVESRSDKRPNIADLRESGALEQDADVIMLLYRDEYYNSKSTDIGMVEVNIAKNRNGVTQVSKLSFEKDYTKFSNLFTFPE